MTCTKCGKPLVDGATFCGYCGTPVSSLPQKCDGSANEPDCNTASTGDVDTSASSSSAASHSTFNVLKPFKKLFKWFFFPTFKDQNGSPIKPFPPVDKKLWYSHDKAERKAYREKYNETYGENNRLYRKKFLPAILLRCLIIIALIQLFTPKYAPNIVSTDSWKYAMCSTVTVSELKDSWNDYVERDLRDSSKEVNALLSIPGMGWFLDEENLYTVATDPGSPNIEKAIYETLQDAVAISLAYEKDTQRIVGIEIRYSLDYMDKNTAQNNHSILIEHPCKLASMFSGLSEEFLLKKFDNAVDSRTPYFYTRGIACGLQIDDDDNVAITQILCSANNPFSK